MVFKDESKKSLSGSSASKDKIALSGEVGLGSIVLDLETGLNGKVMLLKLAQVLNTTVSAKDAFDFTGTYSDFCRD